MAQLKPIIVVCTIVAVSFLLISWIPPGFYPSEQEGRTLEAPGYFSAVDIERYGDVFNHTMNGTGAELYPSGVYYMIKEVGGHTLEIYYPEANATYYQFILGIYHCETWGVAPLEIIVNKHSMNFYHEKVGLGIQITETQLNTYKDDLTFEMSCNHINLDMYFAYNATTYSSPVEAFDHNELTLLIGVEWDEMATGMSAWDFVAAIMFFNLPNTHWMITALIAIPLWLSLLYAAITIILTVLDLLPFT